MNIRVKSITSVFLAVFLAVFLFSGCTENSKDIQPATSFQGASQVQDQIKGIDTVSEVSAIIEEPSKLPVEEVSTESVSFATENKNDSSLEKGQTKVAQEGKEGLKELKYSVTYEHGIETGRNLISEAITVQPVNRIVLIGTKEAPAPVATSASCGSDYYMNVDGNCVHRPSSSPSGASAKCKDGSYSYSQHRQGTCSGHGGVAQWL